MYIGNVIIPTDELTPSFFRGVGLNHQPDILFAVDICALGNSEFHSGSHMFPWFAQGQRPDDCRSRSLPW